MTIHINVCIFKIMHTPIKVGIHMYATYTNCWTLPLFDRKVSYNCFINFWKGGMLIMSMLIQERSACYLRIIWKYLRMKLLLTAITNGLLKTFSDSFISLDGILSMPVYFLLSIIIESFSWIISRNCWKVAAPAVGLRLAWLASD